MRWEGLFADLEGQLAAEQRRERDDEVAERTRRERALVTLPARLAAAVGAPVRIGLVGGLQVDGDLEDLGEDWVLVRTTTDAHEVLVPLAAVVTAALAGVRSPTPARTARRFGSAMPCGRCRATAPPWSSRWWAAARGCSGPSTPWVPTTSTSPSTTRGCLGAGRTSGPWPRCRSPRSWRWSHALSGPQARARTPVGIRPLGARGRRPSALAASDRVVTRSRVSAYMRWM